MKKKLNKKEFCDEILKLAPSEYDASKCDFQQHLRNILDDYLEMLDKLDDAERPKKWNSITKKNKQLINAIKETVELYYEGRHSSAFKQLDESVNDSLKTISLDFPDLYRMRVFDEYEKHDRNGMFHIPFNKRTIVKTQRYSAPGYPCLYLGASAYVCWEEMLRPNLDKCYVSRFHTDKKLCVYDLSLPSIDSWNSKDKFCKDLLRLPLVLACMVKVAKPKDPFKPEYIIPQLLMEWVIEQRDSNHSLMGIAYHSVHKSNDFKFSLAKSVNLAIPAFLEIGNIVRTYGGILCDMFQLTEPTCDELERAKSPYASFWKKTNMNEEDKLKYNYQISTFGQLEARLNVVEEFPLEKIDNK